MIRALDTTTVSLNGERIAAHVVPGENSPIVSLVLLASLAGAPLAAVQRLLTRAGVRLVTFGRGCDGVRIVGIPAAALEDLRASPPAELAPLWRRAHSTPRHVAAKASA